MNNDRDSEGLVRQSHQQMLKLVARSFYKELINYGVNKGEVLAVAGHLLDSVRESAGGANPAAVETPPPFRIGEVRDDWAGQRRLALQQVSLSPLTDAELERAVAWLNVPAIRESFYPHFPTDRAALRQYFQAADREYFCIYFEQEPAGLIGAEHIDRLAAKLEMRKLVGNPALRGKGIGKRATFLFLYYVFAILKFRKIYIHSLDVNIRNLNLNSRFGFELEGVFLQDAWLEGRCQDVVRMGLLASAWRGMFA